MAFPQVVLWASSGAVGAATSVTHDYEMNEPAGATVMKDTGTTPVNGKIGSGVTTGVHVSGATAYRFPFLKPNTPPAHPEHLVNVPDSASVDPETGTTASRSATEPPTRSAT
jgi:hypothetical protein